MKSRLLTIFGASVVGFVIILLALTILSDDSSTTVFISCDSWSEQIGDHCVLLKPEQYCIDWCDYQELSNLGCGGPVLDYIYRHTNLFDEKFDNTFYFRNFMELPDGVSEKQFEECADIVHEKRIPYDLEKLESFALDNDNSMGFCAYVGAERLSEDEMQRIKDNPHHRPLKFLNFTDEHMSQVPALKDVVDKLALSEFPLNDRGYVTVTAYELQNIKDYLYSKSDSQTLSSHIVVNGNLYSINGMISFPIDPNGESLNIQFDGPFEDRKDDFTEEAIMKNPSKNYVTLTEDELEEIKPIKDAIDQIETWEMKIRYAKDVGDTTQNQVMDFIESESLKQMGPDPEKQTFDFYYDGNYYRSEFVIC